MSVTFFDITRQNQAVANELSSAIKMVVDSGRYILGENVSLLEKEVAAFVGAKYAVGVSSGTDALHLALRACGIQAGDEVITTPFTFVATVEAIVYCGATPVFVDIEPNSFNLDPAKIEEAISKKCKAIIPVHLYGQACNMTSIMDLASRYKLKVIEDCAQAIGAAFDNRQVGSFGDAGCFSFFPTKNLGCFGDGGLVTTSSATIYEELKVLRGHGSRKTYHYDLIGYNSRLDELQAAIIRIKLPHLTNYLSKRRQNAEFYYKNLTRLKELALPSELISSYHTYNQFTLRSPVRSGLMDALKTQGIGAMVYYPLCLHLQSAYKWLGYSVGAFPESERAQEEVISLPIFPELTEIELSTVCSAIKEYLIK